ncbi:MAG: Glycerol kinase, partial [uncultured Rubrobacteraceae bacterium]
WPGTTFWRLIREPRGRRCSSSTTTRRSWAGRTRSSRNTTRNRGG